MAPYKGGQRSGRKSPSKPKAPKRPPVRSSDPRTNRPGGVSKPKPKPSVMPQRQGPAVPTRLAKAPSAPKLPAPTRTTTSRFVATRPAAKPKAPTKAKPPMAPKAPAQVKGLSAPLPPKMPAAQSSFGPVKSGEDYGRMIGAPKAPSSSSAPATKKKSSALSQAEIRKRKMNR
jgi:hypothetical protein